MQDADHLTDLAVEEPAGDVEMTEPLRGMVQNLIDHLCDVSRSGGKERRALEELSERIRTCNAHEQLQSLTDEMIDTCKRLGNSSEQSDVIQLLRGMVEDLIGHMRNRSSADCHSRQFLDGLAARLSETNEPEALAKLSNELNLVCIDIDSESEQAIQKALDERQQGLKAVIQTLSTGMKILTSSNDGLSSTISAELKNIEQTIASDDPLAAGEAMTKISQKLLGATKKAQGEIKSAQTQMHEVSSRVKQLEEELEETRKQSLIDGLTHLHNRRAFNDTMDDTLEKKGIEWPCSLLMLDIDHFKRVNDIHGHLIGDALLKKLARILEAAVDEKSFAARYGGEEFAVIIGCSTLITAKDLAEEIRDTVKNSRWTYKREDKARVLSATVSIGIAHFRNNDTAESVIERADKALYLAKESGRNQSRTELEIE